MLQAAEAHYRRQARVAAAVSRQIARQWARITPANLDAWNPATGAQLVAALQLLAARDADRYLAEVLSEQNQPNDPAGRINPLGFAGAAGDGRSLVTLLDQPRIDAKSAIGQGMRAADAYAAAGTALQLMAVTAVQDAGRAAESAGMAARPHVNGFYRMLNTPSCARCAILAGKFFRWNAGFDRHPGCDCTHIPTREDVAGDVRTDPQALFDQGLVNGVTKAEQKAISAGADLNQVVNARRSIYMDPAGRRLTHEATTRRGGRGINGVRPTPEQIYREAKDDRAEALRLLSRFGYII